MSMTEVITPILQNGANIAIELNTRFLGIDCEIYYPKSNEQTSSKIDDTTYSDTPDELVKLLIPDIYNLRRTSIGGLNDNLFQETFTTYVKHDHHIPHNSKIVAISEKLGVIQFIVDESDSVTTFIDSIYRELSLVPYMSFRNSNPEVVEVNERLATEILDESHDKNYEFDNPNSESVPNETTGKFTYRPVK